MKEIILTLLYFLLIKNSSQDIVYTLKKYKSYIYNEIYPTYGILESINVEGKEIEITYEIQDASNFTDTALFYYFTDTKLENNTIVDKSNFKDYVYCKKNESSNSRNTFKAIYRIKKNKKYKYLVLQNLPNEEGKNVEVKNKRTTKKTVIIIFIISLIITCGIIVAFVFVGKYIYSKRQKEVMANYASSFVAENPGLMPNEENNAIENNENRDSNIKIDD